VTKTAVVVLSEDGILIVAIPPLSPQPPDFSDVSQILNQLFDPTYAPPLFTIKFPDGIELRQGPYEWKMISSWYIGSSHHFYFDMLSDGVSKRHRFQIKLKPDLSTASLHAINIPGLAPLDVDAFFEGYRICEDTLVSCSFYNNGGAHHCEVHTESTSACFGNFISHSDPATKMLLPNIGRLRYFLFPCPASGRLVRLDSNNSVAILDLF
jgi:hypothetical protein